MSDNKSTAPAMPKGFTVDGLKAWAREHREMALVVAKAQAFAQVERERVDAYIVPIFVRYGFTDDLGASESKRGGRRDGEPSDAPRRVLTDPKYLYLSEDEERCKAYYAECELAHREHGYRGEEGTCPALVAEDIQCRAENILLDALAKFTGADGFNLSLDLRKRALDLAMTCAIGGFR